jgi:hypothetical protein
MFYSPAYVTTLGSGEEAENVGFHIRAVPIPEIDAPKDIHRARVEECPCMRNLDREKEIPRLK